MKVYVLFFHLFMLLKLSDPFELESPLAQLLSQSKNPLEKFYSFDKSFKQNHLLNQLLPKQDSIIGTDNSSAICFKAIEYLLSENLKGRSFQFLDAWGSIPAGILYAHWVDLGNFNECLSARATIKSLSQQIRGKYVLVEATAARNNTSYMNSFIKFSLRIGTCFPNTCSDEDVRKIFQTSISTTAGLSGFNQKTKIDFSIAYTKTEDEHKLYNTGSITAICIFSTLGALMLFSTLYEYIMTIRKTPPHQALMAFSVLTNGRKLFQINTNSNNNKIDCLNGLRVISMMWIIYGHSQSLLVFYPLINTIDVLSFLQKPFSMLSQAAPFAVDSFLLISGLLITWLALPKMEKNGGKLNIPLMYFHRYIRLTPVVAVSILFVVGIWPLIDTGPWLYNWQLVETRCQQKWWINFLYINNYLDFAKKCLNQTWYLSADMQLFFISPLILMGLWKWKSKFLWLLLLILMLSTGCCLVTMMSNNMTGIIMHGLYDMEQTNKIHFPTHIRIPSWLIGVSLGYLLHCNRNKKPRFSVIHLTIGWIVALLLMATVIFVPYHFSRNLSQATSLEAALFAALGRSAWSLALSWIIFVCHSGYSRTLNSFLSYTGWQPFVRLTYTMYILSIILQTVNLTYNRTDVYFSTYNLLQSYAGELITTMGWSVLVVLAVESPIIAIEKYLFALKKQKALK